MLEQGTSCKWRAKNKKLGIAILISDKIDFKIKGMKRNKERHYIMIKESIQEDVTIINTHTHTHTHTHTTEEHCNA